MFSGMGKHEVRLTGHKAGPCGIDVTLVTLKFDCQGCNVVVDLTIVCDLTSQPPIIGVHHCHLENLKVATGAGEHVAEPGWQGLDGGTGTSVGLSVEVDNVRLFIGPLCRTIPRDHSVVVEAYPLSLLVESIADGDVEVSNLHVIEVEALRRLVEGPLIVENALFKAVELILIGFGGDGGVSLAIGDDLK
jgi:hypothetical protein